MNKNFNSIRYSNNFSIDKVDELRIGKILKMMGKNKHVLDIGCGDGFIMTRIKKYGNKVDGIEIADNAIKKARNKGFKIYDVSLNDDNWANKINKKFDVILAGEIIEHIFDTDNFLQNIKRLLNNKGVLIITTPNIASFGRRIFLLMGYSPLIEITARKNDAGHVRYFTRGSLKKLLIENSYQVCKIESTVINLSRNGKVYSTLMAKLFPGMGNNIVIMAKK